MSTQTGQAPVLDYRTLDDLGGQVAAAVAAIWLLRGTMPEAEWIALVVSVLLSGVLQGETWGRLYGSVAVPVNGVSGVPVDNLPRRPVPAEFVQRTVVAPKPEAVIDFAAREVELTERLTKAVETLAVEDATPARVARLARDEPIAAVQRGFQDGVRLQETPVAPTQTPVPPPVELGGLGGTEPATGSNALQPATVRRLANGYRRGLNPGACELCFWLWKEGYVYDIDQPMHRHTGCRCVPVVTADRQGKNKLSAPDKALLADLYDRYVINNPKDAHHAAA